MRTTANEHEQVSNSYKIYITQTGTGDELGAAAPVYVDASATGTWKDRPQSGLLIRDTLNGLGFKIKGVSVSDSTNPAEVVITFIAANKTDAELSRIRKICTNYFFANMNVQIFDCRFVNVPVSAVNIPPVYYNAPKPSPKPPAKPPAAKDESAAPPDTTPKPEKTFLDKLAEEFKVTKNTVLGAVAILVIWIAKE